MGFIPHESRGKVMSKEQLAEFSKVRPLRGGPVLMTYDLLSDNKRHAPGFWTWRGQRFTAQICYSSALGFDIVVLHGHSPFGDGLCNQYFWLTSAMFADLMKPL